jgi:hypothetical protein
MRGCWKLKGETLYCTVRSTRFRGCCWPVIRRATGWTPLGQRELPCIPAYTLYSKINDTLQNRCIVYVWGRSEMILHAPKHRDIQVQLTQASLPSQVFPLLFSTGKWDSCPFMCCISYRAGGHCVWEMSSVGGRGLRCSTLQVGMVYIKL